MTIRFRQLDEATRLPFEQLLTHVWPHRSADFQAAVVRWRYYTRPANGGTWLAFDGDRCVALIDSFLRAYLLDGRRLLVRETCEWFCLPEYRPRGIGTLLMRKMMAGAEPIFGISGTAASLAMFPRLRWRALEPVQKWLLAVKARTLLGSLLRAKWPPGEAVAKFIPNAIPIRPRPRLVMPSRGIAEVRDMYEAAAVPLPSPRPEGLVQILDQADRDWLAKMPSRLARPIGLVFLLNGESVGASFSQLEPAASGIEGRIVHLQIACGAAQEIFNWVVTETARRLVDAGAGIIRCWASVPEKIAALRQAGFMMIRLEPTYWWSRDRSPAPARIDAGYLRADDAIPFH
ncbi:MAG: GNAT family N-acetyltransferase [Acetobacteraceae bacterium]|nr:GNAT family N-acetyltransferase [Acetobacteraceae bacterium]MBV8525310.1 GNAT family N-acetyltransferase [Acetobacteraceae bacterium]